MVKIDGNRLLCAFKKDIIAIRVEMLNLRVKDISEMNKQENDAA